MVEDGKTLEEVVVVGYATQKKVNLTGSVSTVNLTEQAESRPMTSLSTGLAGLSSGLYVNQGQPVLITMELPCLSGDREL